jgi:hypothetical protein
MTDDLPPDDDLEAAAPEVAGERIDIDALIAKSGFSFGNFDPWAVGKSLGMTEQAIKLGIGLLLGLNKTAAGRAAGFANMDTSGGRGSASRATKSAKLQKFLELAKAAKAGPPTGPLTDDEKESILAKIARGGNEQLAVRAILGTEQLKARKGDEKPFDPKSSLQQLASRSVVHAFFAHEFARLFGLDDFDAAEHLTGRDREVYIEKQAALHVLLGNTGCNRDVWEKITRDHRRPTAAEQRAMQVGQSAVASNGAAMPASTAASGARA